MFELRPSLHSLALDSVLVVGSIIATWVFDPELVAAAAFFSVSSSAFEITQELRRAKLRPGIFFAASALRSIIGFALGLTIVLVGAGGYGLLLAISASYILGVLLYIRSTCETPIAPFDWTLLRRFIGYGIPFAASGVLFIFSLSFDRLFVGYLLGQSAAGQYGAASDLARQAVFLVAMSAASSIFPMAFRSLNTTGVTATQTHLRDSIELFVAMVAPIALILALSAGAFSSAVVGAQYKLAVAELVPLLALARFLGSIGNFYVHISFQLSEKSILQIIHGAATLAFSIIFVVIMTVSMGLLGAAIGSVLFEAAGLCVGVWLVRYSFPLPWAPVRIMRIALCLLVMLVVSSIVREVGLGTGTAGLVAIISSGILSYILCCLALDVSGVRQHLLSSLRASI